MKTYVFPGTDWEVSRLAYGCGAIGGAWDTVPLDNDTRLKATAILDAVFESGINFIDHADVYTFGKSEQVFGEYLKANPGLRESIYIQSKCGIRFENTPEKGDPARYDFSREHIIASVDGTLSRLGVEYLDVLLLHRPDALMEPEEIAAAFDELEAAGKVRHFGVSNHSIMQLELLKKQVKQPLVVHQLQMSLAQPALVADGVHVNVASGENRPLSTGLLDYCRFNDMLVQAWSPVGGGGFYTQAKDGVHPRQALLDVIRTMAQARGCSEQAIMLAWLLRHPAKIQPIVGTMTPDRLRESVAADAIDLGRTEWYRLLNAAMGHNVP